VENFILCPNCKKDLDDIDLSVGIADRLNGADSTRRWNCPYCKHDLQVSKMTIFAVHLIK